MTRFLLGIAPFLFVFAGSAGCTEAPESVGSISIALTAPGAGGSTYRLPPGTSLFLSTPTFGRQLSLDDDAPSVTVQVPPGDYSVSLFDSGGDTTVWPLQRQNADGTTETVSGTLDLTPTISVVENQTTDLVIRFHVVGSSVTFSMGSVDVSVDVDETPSPSSWDIVFSVPSLVVWNVTIGATAPAELPPRLPALNDTGDRYTLTLHTVGAWFITQPNAVCIQITGSSIDAGGNPGFIELIAEAPPSGDAQLCLNQDNGGSLVISFNRQGHATTPLLSDLSDGAFLINYSVEAAFFTSVFDGTKLHFEALLGTRFAFLSMNGHISTFPGFDPWYSMAENGNGTLTVTPHRP
jgi:hypothetical protein